MKIRGGDFITNNKLRDIRESNNSTIDEFSKMLGINKISYYQYETGARTIPANIATQISKKLNIPTDDIFLPSRYSIREQKLK